MSASRMLEVVDWAAILGEEPAEELGAAEGVEAIPAQQRRRLPAFARDVARCALPVLRNEPRSPVVFASRHGDLRSNLTLLADLVKGELLSPTLFGLSVHNAPAGVVSLLVQPTGDHTAIAGLGRSSLGAALVEVYTRLATREAGSVVLIYADGVLPEVYAQFDAEAESVFLAMALRFAGDEAPRVASLGSGQSGVATLARALAAGARGIDVESAALMCAA